LVTIRIVIKDNVNYSLLNSRLGAFAHGTVFSSDSGRDFKMAATQLFILFLTATLAIAAAAEGDFGIFHSGFELDGYQAHFHPNTDGSGVVIHVVGRTAGYVGFGIAPAGVMHEADLFIGGCTDAQGGGAYYAVTASTMKYIVLVSNYFS